MLPTDPRAQQIFHNPTALMFADYWQQRERNEDYNRLGEMLGVRWTRNMVETLFAENKLQDAKKRKEAPTEVVFPLAAIIEPSLQEHVKKTLGRKFGAGAPGWARDEHEFVDMFSMPKEEFMQFVGGFLPMAKAADPKNTFDPHVSINQWRPKGMPPRR